MTNVTEAQANECAKYRWLLEHKPHYFNTDNGKSLLPHVLAPVAHGALHVDLGCGDNSFCKAVRAAVPRARSVGVDFCHPDADHNAYLHGLPLDSYSADIVTSFDVLEHLLEDNVEKSLEEMSRISHDTCTWIHKISCRPSNIKGPNGSNLHPTVRPPQWWQEKLCNAFQPTFVRKLSDSTWFLLRV